MKNYSKRWLWLIGGIFLSSILCLVVSAVNVNIDISNAVQHINRVRLINSDGTNQVIISKIGSNLVNIETNSNIILGSGNTIEESSENSTILGGIYNEVKTGGSFSTIIAGVNNYIGEGTGNTILGGSENNVKGQNSVIAGGEGNYIEGNASSIVGGNNNNISGNYSVIVGNNNSVTGNVSVAMGINSYVSGNNSFLWSDSSRSDVLEADNVFAIVSQNGMVINSDTSNPNAKLTLGGSLVVASNDKDQDIVCEGGTGAGIVKAVLTGDQYCLCSCDGQGRNSMFGGGICKSLCNGDTQPICGTGVSLIHSGSSYMFEGSCEQGNVVEGTGAYLLDKDNVLHWTCQLGNGESVSCSSSDITPVYRNCELPWGGTIQHGQSVLAYESSNPEGGCVSQLRECNDGNLTGENYQYENCAPGCKKPWSDTKYIKNGETLEAFNDYAVEFGNQCESMLRFCDNGVLLGDNSFEFKQCEVNEPQKCQFKGLTYPHLGKLIIYNRKEGLCPDDGCEKHVLISRCYNGMWLNGGSIYWKELGNNIVEPLKDIGEIPSISAQQFDEYNFDSCNSLNSSNDYILDACPSNGTCSCTGVSLASNGAEIPVCKPIVQKCKLDNCNAGFFKDLNVCKPCPAGYTSNTGAIAQNKCFITCNDKYHLNSYEDHCTICGVGTYKSIHTVNYGNKTSCTPCNNGPQYSTYTSNGVNNNCEWQCNEGYYRTGNDCRPIINGACGTSYYYNCSAGTVYNTGTNGIKHDWTCKGEGGSDAYCFVCVQGYVKSGTDCISAPRCGSASGGYYSIAPTSNLCNQGTSTGVSHIWNSALNWKWSCEQGGSTVDCYAYETEWRNNCGGSSTMPSGPTVVTGTSSYQVLKGSSEQKSWTYTGSSNPGVCEWTCGLSYQHSATSDHTSNYLSGYGFNYCYMPCYLNGSVYPGTTLTGYMTNSRQCPELCSNYEVSATCNINGTITYSTGTANGSRSFSNTCTQQPYNPFSAGGQRVDEVHSGEYENYSLIGYRVVNNSCVSYEKHNVSCLGGYTWNSSTHHCQYNPGGGASGGGGGGSTNTCFLAGTPVSTIDGFKNIEDIEVGDMVLSYNTITQEYEYNKVLKKFVHENSTDDIYRLVINGKILEATEYHPFYVIGSSNGLYQCNLDYRRVLAKNLKVGDKLMMSDGSVATIEEVTYRSNYGTTYNMHVENTHTYFVGEGYLVHNAENNGNTGVGPGGGDDHEIDTGFGCERIGGYCCQKNSYDSGGPCIQCEPSKCNN